MARLITSGGEHRDHPTTDVGSPDGVAAGVAMCVTELTTIRSGKAAIKCMGTASDTSFRYWPFTSPALGADVFARVHFRVSALPSATAKVAAIVTSADGALVSVRLTAGGVFQLWNDAAGTQIGSDTALVAEVDRWHRIQVRVRIGTGAVDEAEARIQTDDYQSEEEVLSGATLTISDTLPVRLRAGWIDAPGVTSDLFLDDVALNDSTGTDHNTWPGDGRVTLLLPAGTSTLGVGSWTDCSGAAAPWDGMNKQPPVGLADHTTAGHTGASAHQARVAVNTVQSMLLRLRAWATSGVLVPAGVNPSSMTTVGTTGTTIGTSSIANPRRAQNFSFGAQVAIDEILVGLAKTGAPTDDVIVEIQGDSGGFPDGTTLASGSVPAASITSTSTRFRVALNQTTILDADVTYHVVLSRSGAANATNHFTWAKASATVDNFVDYTPSVHNGTSWLRSGTQYNIGEHVFQITPLQGVYPPVFVAQFACHGQDATGVKAATADAAMGTGPTPAQDTFNFGDNVGVAGTYPSNWRWSVGAGIRPRISLTLATANPTITITKASGSGTTPCLVCQAGLIVEYTLPAVGWTRWQKTSDSTFYWAKRVMSAVSFELADASIVEVPPGDWAIYPEPAIGEGEDFPATLVSITDAALNTSYVAV